MFAGELPPLASAVQRAAEDEREVKFRVAYDVSVSHLQRHRTPRRAPPARPTVAPPSSHRRGMLMRSERSRGTFKYGGYRTLPPDLEWLRKHASVPSVSVPKPASRVLHEQLGREGQILTSAMSSERSEWVPAFLAPRQWERRMN